jgi:hypothetical protein
VQFAETRTHITLHAPVFKQMPVFCRNYIRKNLHSKTSNVLFNRTSRRTPVRLKSIVGKKATIMINVRQPVVAGQFYPADANELHAMVTEFLASAKTKAIVPKAFIVPHAGYIYSGEIAATCYAQRAFAKSGRGIQN